MREALNRYADITQRTLNMFAYRTMTPLAVVFTAIASMLDATWRGYVWLAEPILGPIIRPLVAPLERWDARRHAVHCRETASLLAGVPALSHHAAEFNSIADEWDRRS